MSHVITVLGYVEKRLHGHGQSSSFFFLFFFSPWRSSGEGGVPCLNLPTYHMRYATYLYFIHHVPISSP